MNKSELLAFVSINGMDLVDGANKRTVCPECKAEHEQSFMIRKNDLGELTGYCFRVSCPISGKVIGDKGVYTREARTKVSTFKPRVYEGEKISAPVALKIWLFQQYNIPLSKSTHEGMGYDTKYGRMVFPVYDHSGYRFGYMTKAMPSSNPNYPKWITYFERETNKIHYPLSNVWCDDTKSKVVLVEDIISAIRVSQYVPCVALLGTHMTQDMVNELRKKFDSVLIALDPDATSKALKMQQKFSTFFTGGIGVRPMQLDPKDIEEDAELLKQLGV